MRGHYAPESFIDFSQEANRTKMLEALAKQGFLHKIDREDEPHYSVARPPSAISTNELLDVAMSLSAKTPDPDSASAQWVEEYRAALRNLDVHRSIAEL